MTFQTRKTHAGFTLIESMMTLGVAAILCAVSLPALGGLVHGTQSRVAREAMFTSLNLARNTAVTRQQEIVLCASSDGARCDGDIWWHDGWIVFQDTNRDGKRDLDEPLIEVAQGQHDVTIATSTDRTRIVIWTPGLPGDI